MASLSEHTPPTTADDKTKKKKAKKTKKTKKKVKSNATPAKKRLMRDFKKMMNDKTSNCSAAPVNNNIFQWQAVLFGPGDTPWEGGTFHLLMDFTEEYPNKPPTVKFVTKMFHPNVSFSFLTQRIHDPTTPHIFLWPMNLVVTLFCSFRWWVCFFTHAGLQRWQDMH